MMEYVDAFVYPLLVATGAGLGLFGVRTIFHKACGCSPKEECCEPKKK